MRTLRVGDAGRCTPMRCIPARSARVAKPRSASWSAGRIQQRAIEVGDTVAKGTLLFRLDPTDAALNANASRSQVASARSQYEQAKNDYARFSQLSSTQYVSRAELDKARMSLQTAQEALRAAQANNGVVANQANYTTLRSTVAGVVTSLEAEAGQVVSAGQVVARIAERGERELIVSIPESRVDELRTARALTVELWADPRHRYTGSLRELAPDADAVTRTYSAKVSVVGADDRSAPGHDRETACRAAGQRRAAPPAADRDLRSARQAARVDRRSEDLARAPASGGALAGEERRRARQPRPARRRIVVTAGVNLLHAGQKVPDCATPPRERTSTSRAWAIAHPQFVLFLMLLFAAGGIFAWRHLGQAEDPTFTVKAMVVQAKWPGAGADAVAQQVTDRIERKLQEVAEVDYLSSFSKPGVSQITVALRESTCPPRKRAGRLVPGAQEARRHPGRVARRRAGADVQRRVRRYVRQPVRVHQRRVHATPSCASSSTRRATSSCACPT